MEIIKREFDVTVTYCNCLNVAMHLLKCSKWFLACCYVVAKGWNALYYCCPEFPPN